MVELEKKVESPLDLIRRGIETLPAWLASKRDGELGPIAIELREFVDRFEGISAETVRRFEKSGAWAKDGATDMIAWLKCNGKLSGGAAMERVSMGRQLEKLPETAQAFQRGDLGYGHVAILTRTAENESGPALSKKKKPACCRRPSRWTPANSRKSRGSSRSGSTRRRPLWRPTGPTAGATCT